MKEYIVEYYEEATRKFRVIVVTCDNPAFADVEAMKKGANILKVSKIYEKADKEKKNLFHPINLEAKDEINKSVSKKNKRHTRRR